MSVLWGELLLRAASEAGADHFVSGLIILFIHYVSYFIKKIEASLSRVNLLESNRQPTLRFNWACFFLHFYILNDYFSNSKTNEKVHSLFFNIFTFRVLQFIHSPAPWPF